SVVPPEERNMPTVASHDDIFALAAARRVASASAGERFLNGTRMRKPLSSGRFVLSASELVHAVASRRVAFFGLCLYASHIAPARNPAVQELPSVVFQRPSVPGAPLPAVLLT